MQSVGQACLLQGRVSAVCGHAAPPFCGWTCVRLRDCNPAPHDLVHVDQAIKSPTTQSTPHVNLLQGRVSAECGHALPPFEDSVSSRSRCCEPVPHDSVHVLQLLKPRMMQSTGHAAVLQACVSAECGQALPPKVGSALVRLRF